MRARESEGGVDMDDLERGRVREIGGKSEGRLMLLTVMPKQVLETTDMMHGRLHLQ